MGRGRPPLPIGTYGEISVTKEARKKDGRVAYRAKARFRDTDGVTRPVVRYADSENRAKRALKAALAERRRDAERSTVGGDTTVEALGAMFLESGDWATNTIERYALAVRKQITPLLGQVRVRELRRPVINAALARIKAESGPGAAASAKTVLAGMCKLAMTYDALDANPVRDTISVAGSNRETEPPRSMTDLEIERLTDALRADVRAVELDLADLVDVMLGTGCRIGEACACRDEALNASAGTWEINATVVRVKGRGLEIQRRPKTAAGWRVLALPRYVSDLIARRRTELRFARVEGVVLGSPRARALRDPSNTAGDLRETLDRVCCPVCAGVGWHAHLKTERQNVRRRDNVELCDGTPPFAWVTSHVFRKTVATKMDDAGLSARMVADQLGHAKPSMTQDVYMGRRVVSAAAARVLDR